MSRDWCRITYPYTRCELCSRVGKQICESCGANVFLHTMEECDLATLIAYQATIGNPPPIYKREVWEGLEGCGTAQPVVRSIVEGQCVVCGKSLDGMREAAQVCSATCRVRLQRERLTESRLRPGEMPTKKSRSEGTKYSPKSVTRTRTTSKRTVFKEPQVKTYLAMTIRSVGAE